MFNDLTDLKLHYLASVYCTTTKKKRGRRWSVHAPLVVIEEEMVEDGLLETASEWYASYSWIDLGVTKYGKSVLKKIDPKVIALICLGMGDTVLMQYYTDKLTLADLPEFLTSKHFMVRETARRVHDKLTGLT